MHDLSIPVPKVIAETKDGCKISQYEVAIQTDSNGVPFVIDHRGMVLVLTEAAMRSMDGMRITISKELP